MKKEEKSAKNQMNEREARILPAIEAKLEDFYHQHIHRLNSLRVIDNRERVQKKETRQIRLKGLEELPFRPRGVTFQFDERSALVTMYYRGEVYEPYRKNKFDNYST
jgi:hypothetical protein